MDGSDDLGGGWLQRHGGTLLAAMLWAMVVAVALATRPPMPVDETRYLSVAWEMHTGGDWLVPHLLGQPYPHKPPLLFWLINAGWLAFGVSEWWARLVAPLFGLGCVLLTAQLARQLWPGERRVAMLAPLLLSGMMFWAVIATLTMFDTMLGFFALLAVSRLVALWQGFGARGWGGARDLALAALALCLGILAKGPVILLHVAPAAMLMPWCFRSEGSPGPRAWHWQLVVGACVLLAVLGAAAWAIPAALAGGPAYADGILWGQTAGRIAGDHEVNAHAHAWWWYLPMLPALLFPWAVWPPLWRGARHLRDLCGEPGVRLTLVWSACALLTLSAVSGKQVHYLVPLLPVLALLGARLLVASDSPWRRSYQLPIAAVLGLAGLVLAVGPFLSPQLIHILQWGNHEAAPEYWARDVPLLAGATVLALALAVWRLPAAPIVQRVADLAMACCAVVLAVHAGAARAALPAFDLHGLAQRIHAWQDAGIAVARVHPYHGEYQFIGRLEKPVLELSIEVAPAWARKHPDGKIILQFSDLHPAPAWLGDPESVQVYRGMSLGIWPAGPLVALPVREGDAALVP